MWGPLNRVDIWSPSVFCRPPFSHYEIARDLSQLATWPSTETLNALCHSKFHAAGQAGLNFVTSGTPPRRRPKRPRSHVEFYEPRIFITRCIPTRPDNWHDLFNAVIWATFPASKSALNARHYEIFRAHNPDPVLRLSNRSRSQDRMTMFDEGGLIRYGLSSIYFGHGALECIMHDRLDFNAFEMMIEEPATSCLTLTEIDQQLATKIISYSF